VSAKSVFRAVALAKFPHHITGEDFMSRGLDDMAQGDIAFC
jgi:hypothetical protein